MAISFDPVNLALGVGGLISNASANEQNQRNFMTSLDFQREMFDKTNKWNSAQEQVKRLRAAGINPSLAFGQNAGTASAMSAPSANPINPLDLNGLSAIGNSISLNQAQREQMQSQTEKNREEARGINIDNLFRKENWKSLLYYRDSKSWLNDQLSKAAKLDVQYNTLSMKNRLLKLQYETQLQDAELSMKDITMQYMVPEIASRINLNVAESAAAYMTGRASLKSAHAAIMNAANQAHAFDAQFGGNPKDRQKFFNATLDYLVQQRHTAKSTEFHNYGDNPNFGPVGRRRQFNPKTGKWYWVYAE